MKRYKALITTTFRKFIAVNADSEDEAKSKIEEMLNKGEIEGTDTFDFDTDIDIVSPIDEDYERSWGPQEEDD